ncbi:hypothetical protein ZIOFF_070774 [Zingiber officinale]|uniref:Uncharacterized protein n=1 Tax=Zingiber officinale TaxID=94328 RepID=A0A8J5BDM5_ZINOF|nr:hypothetical protein ZIOFF_070774 [Zingiber officinale]
MCFIICTMKKAAALWSPVVGSSRKRSCGRVGIISEILSLFFSPPLIPLMCHFPINLSAHSCSPITRIVVSTTSATIATSASLLPIARSRRKGNVSQLRSVKRSSEERFTEGFTREELDGEDVR